jgi:hypothetical protein
VAVFTRKLQQATSKGPPSPAQRSPGRAKLDSGTLIQIQRTCYAATASSLPGRRIHSHLAESIRHTIFGRASHQLTNHTHPSSSACKSVQQNLLISSSPISYSLSLCCCTLASASTPNTWRDSISQPKRIKTSFAIAERVSGSVEFAADFVKDDAGLLRLSGFDKG